MERINISPRLTSRNFQINDYEIEDGIYINPEEIKKQAIINETFDQGGTMNIKVNDLVPNFPNVINIKSQEKDDFNVVITYDSYNKTKKLVTNSLFKIETEKNSKVNIIVINTLSSKTTNFFTFDANCKEDSKLNINIIDFGGDKSITKYHAKLIGDRAENNLNTIYLGTKTQEFDFNYIIDMYGKESKCKIDVQGALKDKAIKNFKGTIDFKEGCTKANGDENEFCMLLSPKAKSKALPMLLCHEDDVIGSHSSATGKADDKALFYIESRGISERDAQKLLVRAKFNKIIDRIKDEGIRNHIEREIDAKL